MSYKRNIRWDRIVVACVLLVLLIFALGACVKGCTDDDGGLPETTSSADAGSSGTQQNPAGTGSTLPAVTTTTTAAMSTSPNLPVIMTDNSVADQIMPVNTTTTTDPAAEPVRTLPAGYEEAEIDQSRIYSGTLILVNAENPSHLTKEDLNLEQVYFAEDKPDTYEVSYPGHTAANKTALSQFNRLMKAYYAATNNSEIMFNYGYLEQGKEKSNPDSPTALDIQLHLKHTGGGYEYISNTSPYSWLFDHMANYGFIVRYPSNKAEVTGVDCGYTAIRYVGVPHAAYMKERDLCLEEYLDELRSQHNFFGGVLLEIATSEQTYHVYYVAADPTAATTRIPVPKTGSYEVSGNNTDGYIVTAVIN